MDGCKFKELREKQGLTQKKAAQLLGVSIRQIGNLENGGTPVKELYVEKISTYKNHSISGNNNVQTTGNSNVISITSSKTSTLQELFTLIEEYATPKLIEEFRGKLLKIKEIHE